MNVAILLAAMVLVAGYLVWYAWKLHFGAKKLMAELPPANQLSWRVSGNTALQLAGVHTTQSQMEVLGPPSENAGEPGFGSSQPGGSKGFVADLAKDPLTWAAAADGTIAGWSILESSLKIDPQVLRAIEFSTAQDLHGLADFHSYVQDHFFSVPITSADGWFDRLTGYVAEQKAASFFENAGHHVMMAPVANQPVWDMLVDGHPVQIKEHLAGIKDFVVAHPNIDVFTNHDYAAAVHSASVHGLDVLDKDSIHSAASGTIDGLDGTFDPGFNFPFITMAFSVYRESKLLWNEKTSFDRAIVNVGMDVAGVGGGAFLGAKIGAFIGSIIPGPGTVIGGILGSIFGGIGGKMASTGVRHLPLHSARAEYNATVNSAQEAVNAAEEGSKRRVKELQQEYQQKFNEIRVRVEATAVQAIDAKRVDFECQLADFCDQFPSFLRELQLQLEDQERELMAALSSAGFSGMIFPNQIRLQRSALKRWFRRARKTVSREIRNYERLKPRSIVTLYPAVTEFFQRFNFELKSIEEQLNDLSKSLEAHKLAAEEIRRRARTDVEEERQKLIRDFAPKVSSLHDTIVRTVKTWNGKISSARRELQRQAEAVGVNL